MEPDSAPARKPVWLKAVLLTTLACLTLLLIGVCGVVWFRQGVDERLSKVLQCQDELRAIKLAGEVEPSRLRALLERIDAIDPEPRWFDLALPEEREELIRNHRALLAFRDAVVASLPGRRQ